ncbi:MAG: hypothetical protein ACYCW6_20735 [Candidatus Xenobia bacterium]
MEERRRELLALAEADPEDGFTRYLLGQECLDDGLPAEALPHLQAARRLDADNPVVYRALGQALQQLHRTPEALHVWEDGMAVAERTGLLQTGKEMRVFHQRLSKGG